MMVQEEADKERRRRKLLENSKRYYCELQDYYCAYLSTSFNYFQTIPQLGQDEEDWLCCWDR